MITTSYESLSSPRLRHMRRVRKRSRTEELLPDGRERVYPDGAAAKAPGGVRDHRPDVLAERRAEQHQPALLRLAQDRAGSAGHRAGAEAAHGGDGVTQVDRGEAGERLRRERTGEHERALGGGQIDDARVGALEAFDQAR